jgi:multicomponent Na+:H+ antiporter subunit C
MFAVSFSIGLFGVFLLQDYLRKIIAFAIFSNSLIVLFVTIAYKQNSVVAIFKAPQNVIYTDPTPSVLMLTAIVVGISVQCIALSLYLAINKKQ